MPLDIADIDNRLTFFGELLSCHTRFYLWSYDPEGSLLETNCPDLVLNKVFQKSPCYTKLLETAAISELPIIMSIPFGLMWAAAFERDGDELLRIHVLGPVFTTEPTMSDFYHSLSTSDITPHWRPKLIRIFQRVPVITYTTFSQQTVMLHYCVTGEKIITTDITFQQLGGPSAGEPPSADSERRSDRTRLYMAEQAMLHMIREGNLDYEDALHTTSNTSSQSSQNLAGSALQKAKVSRIVFATLCSRAAMEGGLSPEVAYTRADNYIQDIVNAKTVTEVSSIGKSLYEDFIHLVHKQRTNPKYSKPVQNCCDYIENHLGEPISISLLAQRIGYSDYYLSRKFKAETGDTISDYIKFVKIERAKMLLATTKMSIQAISDSLGFGTRNFFSETFRKIAGVPPAAYRKQHRHM
mgnify:CR=1 FL=1